MGSCAAIRKQAGLFCGSFLRKGEVFAYFGLSKNLKDLKGSRPVSSSSSLLLSSLELNDTKVYEP